MADPAPFAGRAPPPLFDIFYGCIFGNFDSLTSINLIVINMQCLQYVFNSLLSLQEHRVCVKGHQNNLQTSKIIPRRDRAPRFLNFWIRYWYGLDRLDYNYLQCSNIATGHAHDMCNCPTRRQSQSSGSR